jgi:glyoxylase-like metal-dependent hydrolase (beta-lactamase superfamily II)
MEEASEAVPATGVPENASGPGIPKSGYLLEEIADRLFWVTDGLYQMIFLRTDDGVLAIDAPPTLGSNILRAIGSVTSDPVRHAVYSHHHADHVGAMTLYEGAQLYAHEAAVLLLEREGDKHRPVPQHSFNDSMTLEVGGQTIDLDYHGPNHSPGNIYIYAPQQQVLMVVDVVFPGWVPFAYLAVSQDVPGWIEAPARMLEYDFSTFVGGHLTRLGVRADIVLQQQYLAQLRAECAKAIDTFDLGALFASVNPDDKWAVFRGYLDGIAAQAAAVVVPAWRDQLGGVAAFTDKNAFAMAESLRIDAGHLGPFGVRA